MKGRSLFLLLPLLAGCASSTAKLPGALPQLPLVERIDAKVGAAFTGPARAYVHSTPLVRFPVGEASAARFRQAWDALFAEVVDLPDWPPWRESRPAVDGVIELDKVAMDVAWGNDLDKADFVRVLYRACLYRPDASPVKCWTSEAATSHQRELGECLSDLSVCVSEQADAVMREAIARFLLEFEADPEVKAWAAALPPRRREATKP
jgi:hypothetical protein